MDSPLLSVRDLVKCYRTGPLEVQALRGVSFDVARGEFAAIVGPSGSGKTTLLDVLGCLSQPSGGSYHIDGRPVHELSDTELARIRNRSIGFVFQAFNLLPRATALENVELPLLYARVPATERRRRARAVLERVGLGARMAHRPNELSGGQMQRVAVARALVTSPLLILADEPTGNLDSATSAEILELFDELHGQGNTILLVTHDPGVAARAGRVLRVQDGRLVADERRAAALPIRHAG
jgi:putative ABC transport system ATP-binding protein